jgi:hypothetical protein
LAVDQGPSLGAARDQPDLKTVAINDKHIEVIWPNFLVDEVDRFA